MITQTITYKSREAARAGVRAYLQQYHPAGYGTTYTAFPHDPFDPIDGYWDVTFTRARSCD